MLNRLEFLLSEAFASLRRNTWMTFAAVTTSAVALFLVGGLAYTYWRVDSYARSLPSKMEMRVFLKETVDQDGIRETAKALRAIDGVAVVVHIPKDRAWEQFQKELGQSAPAAIGNPLPDAMKVTLSDLSKSKSVAAEAAKLEHVETDGVQYLSEEHEFISQTLRLLGWLGTGLFVTLVPTTGILIYIAIRHAVNARRREIRIMQLVGATNATIAVPFLIEGCVQGALGGLLATPALFAVYRLFSMTVQGLFATSEPTPFPVVSVIAGLMLIGASYGLLCSFLAARRPLKLT